jgi:hypothetical protein
LRFMGQKWISSCQAVIRAESTKQAGGCQTKEAGQTSSVSRQTEDQIQAPSIPTLDDSAFLYLS